MNNYAMECLLRYKRVYTQCQKYLEENAEIDFSKINKGELLKELWYDYRHSGKKADMQFDEFRKYADNDVLANYMIALWKKFKHIYIFNEELIESFDKLEDLSTSVDTITKLPYVSFYVDISNFVLSDYVGFFFSKVKNYIKENGQRCDILVCGILRKYDRSELCINFSFDDNITIEELRNSLFKGCDDGKNSKEFKRLLKIIICSIMYLSSEEPDIEKFYRNDTNRYHNDGTLNEIRFWNVGYRKGKNFRIFKSYHSEMNRDKLQVDVISKRPHTRRAHFHHYWTGKKDEKKLTVKWVEETQIHKGEFIPVVSQNVK